MSRGLIRVLSVPVLTLLMVLHGCSGDAKDNSAADAMDTAETSGGKDLPMDTPPADLHTDAKDATDVVPADLLEIHEVLPEIITDHTEQTGEVPVECEDGPPVCSQDGLAIVQCINSQWVPKSLCLADEGKLCFEGQCVWPWTHGNPTFDQCLGHPAATTESLADKAAFYDDVAVRLHLNPELKFVTHVDLPQGEVPCPDGVEGPCLGAVPSVETATVQDVLRWHSGENDGLWSALYMASQAFRYSVTSSPQALETLRILMEGQEIRMKITGVPGLFTRQYAGPGPFGIGCPEEESHYVTDLEKDDNRWVRIGEDGCARVIDRETMEWTVTDHCGLDQFANWCFLDNVSQDEYAGHILALVYVYTLVDDAELKNKAASMLEQVAKHLIDNDLVFVDWDGRPTEHGYYYATSMKDTPGFATVQVLETILAGYFATGNQEVKEYYDNCLLQKAGKQKCLPWPFEQPVPYTDHLDDMFMYMPPAGCKSNWNNMSMMMASFHALIWMERNPETRKMIQDALDTEMMRADNPRAIIKDNNPWYNFIWASQKFLGPDSDGPALDAVREGICTLRQFPARKHQRNIDNTVNYPHDCDGRLDESLTNVAIPVSERCLHTFSWWGCPYRRQKCTENKTTYLQPGDYLLAYWMGRYYGFIGEAE